MSQFWFHFPGLPVSNEWYKPAFAHIWNCWVMKVFSSSSWVSYNYCITASSSRGKEFKMGLKMLLYVTLMTLKSHENEKNYRYQHPFIFVCGQILLRDFLQNWVRMRRLQKKSQVSTSGGKWIEFKSWLGKNMTIYVAILYFSENLLRLFQSLKKS